MAGEGSPPQMDPCKFFRDEIARLQKDIDALIEFINSGELPPGTEEEEREFLRRLEEQLSRRERQLRECEQEAREKPGGN